MKCGCNGQSLAVVHSSAKEDELLFPTWMGATPEGWQCSWKESRDFVELPVISSSGLFSERKRKRNFSLI